MLNERLCSQPAILTDQISTPAVLLKQSLLLRRTHYFFPIGPLSVCLSFLSVTLVYCGQTAGWIKMPLGTEVVLGPGHVVLGGDPAPPKRGTAAPSFRRMCIVAKRSAIWQQLLSTCFLNDFLLVSTKNTPATEDNVLHETGQLFSLWRAQNSSADRRLYPKFIPRIKSLGANLW